MAAITTEALFNTSAFLVELILKGFVLVLDALSVSDRICCRIAVAVSHSLSVATCCGFQSLFAFVLTGFEICIFFLR